MLYIEQFEESVKEYKKLIEKIYDRMEKAYRELNSAENCTNCIYGDGTITDTNYCYDCRWFDNGNNRLKWVGKVEPPKEEDK